MRLVEEFRYLVVKTREVSDNGLLVFEVLGPKGIVEEAITNKHSALHDVQDLVNFIKLVLNETI